MQKTMKIMKKAYAAVLLLAALLLPCCSRDMVELPEEGVPGTETGATDDTEQGYSLRLKVSDAGYRDGLTASRATDEGLTTTFEEGDVLGVYVVNGEGEILYSNVPYTLIGDEWLAPHNVRLKDFPLTVYAYYPYVKDEAMEGKVTAPATEAAADYTATDFFQPHLTELDITDQSTPELYRQADVMACKAEITDEEAAAGSLTLTMEHQMGLVMINLPETVILTEVEHYLKGDPAYTWKGNTRQPANLSDVYITVSDDVLPLSVSGGYRYLCKPEGNVSFSGGFTTYDKDKTYSVNSSTVSQGACKTYNVSVLPFAYPSLSCAPIEYTLKVGDFYMSDGGIRDLTTCILLDDEKQDCVGIVFYTGPLNVNGRTHALVTGLKEQLSTWGPYGIVCNVICRRGDGFIGYSNTKKLLSYPSFPIVSTYNNLRNIVSLPLITTDWYIPSIDELLELYDVYDCINKSLEVLNDLQAMKLSYFQSVYWSCGENGGYTSKIDLKTGVVGTDVNYVEYSVRLCFTF